MSKFELFISLALGSISTAISMLKRQPQSVKRDKWIIGLKAASAALSEIISEDKSDVS